MIRGTKETPYSIAWDPPQSVIVVLNHSKDQETMKIISDRFDWLSRDRNRNGQFAISTCLIHVGIKDQGRNDERN